MLSREGQVRLGLNIMSYLISGQFSKFGRPENGLFGALDSALGF